MEILTREVLKELLEKGQGPCLSLYMTNPSSGDPRQAQIRFKSLLQDGEKALKDLGMKEQEAEAFLEQAKKLLVNSVFWQNLENGLALFLSSNIFKIYNEPFSFSDLVVVAERFHLKPLFPILSGEGKFFILGISQKGVRLLEGTRTSTREIDVDNLPKNVSEALGFDTPQRQLQYHVAGSGTSGMKGTVVRGQVMGAEVEKKYILKYFQTIDKGITDLLEGEQSPLILAGVDYLHSIYREANTYPHLLSEGIYGNPDAYSPKELGEKGWEIVFPHLKKEEQIWAERYIDMRGTGKTSCDIEETVTAAFTGKVDTVFVAVGEQVWGLFDEKTFKATVHPEKQPGDIDLLDFIASHTLLRGGRVYVLTPDHMPDVTNVASLFRF
ncbi:hypothetical protein [Aminobacterium colombiense]|uniref:baeRF7 domain-containing protein n=1 Tax=Aminobacterium colombiense TaxID=81468 RepID=UPI0025988271|nr:hypothetical protein [uncultured Aminobacterium sp.]